LSRDFIEISEKAQKSLRPHLRGVEGERGGVEGFVREAPSF